MVTAPVTEGISLEDFLAHPPERMEWVDGKLLDDSAEELFAKAQECLESGCQAVWLVFPESRRVLVLIQGQTLGFNGEHPNASKNTRRLEINAIASRNAIAATQIKPAWSRLDVLVRAGRSAKLSRAADLVCIAPDFQSEGQFTHLGCSRLMLVMW